MKLFYSIATILISGQRSEVKSKVKSHMPKAKGQMSQVKGQKVKGQRSIVKFQMYNER